MPNLLDLVQRLRLTLSEDHELAMRVELILLDLRALKTRFEGRP